MKDSALHSLEVIQKANADSYIRLDEVREIQEAVLSDQKVDDEEAQALNTLLQISHFESSNGKEFASYIIRLLSDVKDMGSYLTYNPIFWESAEAILNKNFWSYENPSIGAKLDANNDGQISIADVALYKHPYSDLKPNCGNHLNPQRELPYNFAYPQWAGLVHFLRGKILESPNSLQNVREFLFSVYRNDTERFSLLLDAFNIDVDASPSSEDDVHFAIMAIEACLARIEGAAAFSEIFAASTHEEDLEIPLRIQPRLEEGESDWAAMTSSGMLNGSYRVYITLFSDQESLREKPGAVKHEIKHALINRFQGKENHHTLPFLIREPLANYWDKGDGKIELKAYLANTHLALNGDIASLIVEALEEEESAENISDEHFAGNVLFYFFERHYGLEKLKIFCRALLPVNETESLSLERASQSMAGKSWTEVLQDFKIHSPRYLQELKAEEGGGALESLIQHYFGLSWADWFHAHKVNELRQISPEGREALKLELQNILNFHPHSAYSSQLYYLMGQIAMFDGNFSEARNWFLSVNGAATSTALYCVIWSHTLEGNFDQAMQMAQRMSQSIPQDDRFQLALEDISKKQGEGLRARYFDFYRNSQRGEIAYYLDEI